MESMRSPTSVAEILDRLDRDEEFGHVLENLCERPEESGFSSRRDNVRQLRRFKESYRVGFMDPTTIGDAIMEDQTRLAMCLATRKPFTPALRAGDNK